MTESARSHPQWQILKQVYSRRLFRREFLFILVGAAVANLTWYWFINSQFFLLPLDEWMIYAAFAIDLFILCVAMVTGNTFARMRNDGFFNDMYLAGVPWNVILGAMFRAIILLLLLDVVIELPIRFFLTTDRGLAKAVEAVSQVIMAGPSLFFLAAFLILLNVMFPAERASTVAIHLIIIYVIYAGIVFVSVVLFNFFDGGLCRLYYLTFLTEHGKVSKFG
jgi:hypothetical protein